MVQVAYPFGLVTLVRGVDLQTGDIVGIDESKLARVMDITLWSVGELNLKGHLLYPRYGPAWTWSIRAQEYVSVIRESSEWLRCHEFPTPWASRFQ